LAEESVLVTGGAGFIGSNLVDALVRRGHQVAVVDDLSAGRREHVNAGASFHRVDIQEADALARVFQQERPAYVFHLAARASVISSVAEPARDAGVNVLGSLNLLQCCRHFGVNKVVFTSTGGALYGEPRYVPADEQHPVAPLSPYGVSKYAVELYLRAFAGFAGLRFTVLRLANVYGPRQRTGEEGGVVAIFINWMLKGQPVTIFGNGEQQRDFVFVGDVVEACLASLERGDGEAFNIASGIGTSINELFRLLKEQTGYGQAPRYLTARPGEVLRSVLGIDRAREGLGWAPRTPLAEGLGRTTQFWKAQGGSS
jgi:UDP-glucose 4-epimerase